MTKAELKKTIGQNIRRERLARFISIEKLAELLDLSPGFVGLIEHGNRGATTYNLYRLSQIFGISVERLYDVQPDDKKVKLREDVTSKREQLMSVTRDLNEKEFDFLISAAKMLYRLRLPDFEEFDVEEDAED